MEGYFTWLPTFKPKLNEIDQQSPIALSEIPVSFTINSEPPCGWLGQCWNSDCNYNEVDYIVLDTFTYQGDTDYFVYYSLLDGCPLAVETP